MNTLEILDLVDEDDKVIDTLSRDEIYEKNLKYVRVVEAFIRNDEGKLWIPIRAPHKKIAPNGYDVGVGGHVEHGESYDEAFAKEVSEELGWEVSELNYVTIGKFGPNEGLTTISMVYEIHTDDTPELNPEDFVSAEWLKPEDLALKIKNGHPAKMNLLPLLRAVYGVI